MKTPTDKPSAGSQTPDGSQAPDDFDFKPITDGLGFHKKADKLKNDIQLSNLAEETAGRTIPERPPLGLDGRKPDAFDLAGDLSSDLSADLLMDDGPRKASQSISDLIASLPPSLDFLDDKEDAADAPISPAANPYIARTYPPTKREKGRGPRKGGGLSAAFSASSTSDEILPSVSAAAQSAASLFGELAGPRPGATTLSPAKPSSTIIAQAGPQISASGSIGSAPAPIATGAGGAKIFQPLPREDYAPPVAPPKPTFSQAASIGAPAPLAKASGAIAGAGQNATSAPLPPGPMPAGAAAATPASSYADKIQDDFSRAFPHAAGLKKRRIETPASELAPAATSVSSAIVDGMAAAGFASLFLVCILAITKADLLGLLSHAQTDGPTQLHLALLFAVVFNLYSLVGRSFFGATLGEWAFDMQLGDGEDQRKIAYPARALARSLAMTLTGFVVLPIASAIAGKDLGRYVSGVQLYRRP